MEKIKIKSRVNSMVKKAMTIVNIRITTVPLKHKILIMMLLTISNITNNNSITNKPNNN